MYDATNIGKKEKKEGTCDEEFHSHY
jgi:hypothetical protein